MNDKLGDHEIAQGTDNISARPVVFDVSAQAIPGLGDEGRSSCVSAPNYNGITRPFTGVANNVIHYLSSTNNRSCSRKMPSGFIRPD